jgi:O-antigen/teichoic acid export membrane protein
MFSDLGGGGSIVQSPRGEEPAFRRTAFTIAAVRGALLWIAACVAAIPFAMAYGHPILASLIPVCALSALALGLGSTKVHIQNRRMVLRPAVVMDLVCYTFGLVVMIGWGLISPSVWALAAGGVSGSLMRLAWSHALLEGTPDRFGWERASASAIIRFGRWIFVSTLVTFLVRQADRLIFGAMVNLDVLAAYGVASMLAMMPQGVVAALTMKILFPVLSMFHRDGRGMADHYKQARQPILVGCGWVLSGMVAGGPTIISILYPSGFAPAGWMLSVLSAGSWFGVMEAGNGTALLAQGKGHLMAASSVAKLIGMVILIPLGYVIAGFPGAVTGFAASEVVRYVVSTALGRRVGLRTLRQDAGHTLLVLASSAAGWASARSSTAQGWPVLVEAGVVFIAVTAVWLPWSLPPVLRHLRSRA